MYLLIKDSLQSWINVGNKDDQDYDNNVIREEQQGDKEWSTDDIIGA